MAHANFVDTDWLGAHLDDPDLRVIDASWHLPTTARKGDAEFREAHIPGAVFFNIDTIADTSSGLPHMLPDAGAFAKAMAELGLGDGMRFVIYDTLGLFAAARVWWTLRAYGAEDVRILEGGLPKWMREGRPIEAGEANPKPRDLHAATQSGRWSPSLADVKAALAERLGAGGRRASSRPLRRPRAGAAARTEKRPHARRSQPALRRGAGARTSQKQGGACRDPRRAWRRSRQACVTTCGSGVSAAIIALAIEEAGGEIAGLYDGSWAEWGGRDDCPAATGTVGTNPPRS